MTYKAGEELILTRSIWPFLDIWGLLVGVPKTRDLLLGVNIRALDFWKLRVAIVWRLQFPCRHSHIIARTQSLGRESKGPRPAPRTYPSRYSKYHLIETMRPRNKGASSADHEALDRGTLGGCRVGVEVHWGGGVQRWVPASNRDRAEWLGASISLWLISGQLVGGCCRLRRQA